MKKYSRKQARRLKSKGLKVMGRRPLLALILLLASAAFYYWPEFYLPELSGDKNGQDLPEEIIGRVRRVADGDSIEIRDSGRTIKIRLYGVDAPELSQTHGPEARDWLADRILNKTVRVKRVDIDQYNRLVGLVYLDEALVNQALVAAGQAWLYNQYCSINICRQMRKDEKEARRQGRGLWRENKPTPPWIYRRSNPSRNRNR